MRINNENSLFSFYENKEFFKGMGFIDFLLHKFLNAAERKDTPYLQLNVPTL